jgi:hypothetical protein
MYARFRLTTKTLPLGSDNTPQHNKLCFPGFERTGLPRARNGVGVSG